MTRNEFIKYIKSQYAECCNIESELGRLEHSESEGSFIYETGTLVIGKYYYSMHLVNRCGESELLHFCVYGLGIKCNVTFNDYELQSYENFEYMIL